MSRWPYMSFTSRVGDAWRFGAWPAAYVAAVIPPAGVVNDWYPEAATTLDAKWNAAVAPGTPAARMTQAQARHRVTAIKQSWNVIDERGADLRRGER